MLGMLAKSTYVYITIRTGFVVGVNTEFDPNTTLMSLGMCIQEIPFIETGTHVFAGLNGCFGLCPMDTLSLLHVLSQAEALLGLPNFCLGCVFPTLEPGAATLYFLSVYAGPNKMALFTSLKSAHYVDKGALIFRQPPLQQ